MPVAAIPAYLGDKLETASPGLRFGMYLPVWTSREDQEQEVHKRTRRRSPEAREVAQSLERDGMDATIEQLLHRGRNPLDGLWRKNTSAADRAWRNVCALNQNDREVMVAMLARQTGAFSSLPEDRGLALVASSEAPFATGLGNEHPLENGFAFLWPYGLPYLPASGVKGVLRQAARELADGLWGDTRGWTREAIDMLFGHEDSNDARRGALAFWDVIPQIRGNALQVEVMTPHQSKYYQGKESPHDSGQPVPIFFLTVPPGSSFTFHVTCTPNLLGKPGEAWCDLLQGAFEHAFDWLGFGAKTSVGYGAMRIDEAAEAERREREAATRAEADRRAALETATAGLPEDAARIEEWRTNAVWSDTSRFMERVEALLESGNELSPEACHRLREEMQERWEGILENPNATRGKRKKPKYKERARNMAQHILKRCPADA